MGVSPIIEHLCHRVKTIHGFLGSCAEAADAHVRGSLGGQSDDLASRALVGLVEEAWRCDSLLRRLGAGLDHADRNRNCSRSPMITEAVRIFNPGWTSA